MLHTSLLPAGRSVARRLRKPLRRLLYLEILEDRSLLNAAALIDWRLGGDRPFTETEVVVGLRSTQPLADLSGALRSASHLAQLVDISTSEVLFGQPGNYTVQVALRPGVNPLAALRLLDALPAVTWAAPNFIYQGDPREWIPDDPQVSQQYHHTNMQNYAAWDYWFGNTGVIIGITDDGIDLNHQDLRDNIWINPGEIPPSRVSNLTDIDGDGVITFIDLQDGRNRGPFKANDTNGDGVIDSRDLRAPMQMSSGQDLGGGGWANGVDDDGNTYVDDIVGWNTINNNNDPGPGGSHGTHVAGIAAGRAQNGVGIAGTAGQALIMPIRFYPGTWTSTVVARSYAYAANNGAKIVTTSYNVDQFASDPIFVAGVQYMYDRGVLHFNSAGNNSSATGARQRVDGTLYVCSTNQNDVKSSFSNWGYGVDMCAPGENILSTLLNNTYGLNSGTSMASPNAAGVAALLWSIVPSWTRDQVAAQLLGSCDNIDAQNPAWAGQLGCGRVNSFRAITDIVKPPQFRRINGLPAEGGSTSGQIRTFQTDLANVFEPWTVDYTPNWEMREAGADGRFDTADDRLVSMTYATTSGSPYQIGTNRLYFTLGSVLTPGSYRFRAFAGNYETYEGLFDPFYQPLDGNGDGVGGDHFDRHFFVLGAGPSPGGGGDGGVIAALGDTVVPASFGGSIPALTTNLGDIRQLLDSTDAVFAPRPQDQTASPEAGTTRAAANSWLGQIVYSDWLTIL